jgi:hypothetical protein
VLLMDSLVLSLSFLTVGPLPLEIKAKISQWSETTHINCIQSQWTERRNRVPKEGWASPNLALDSFIFLNFLYKLPIFSAHFICSLRTWLEGMGSFLA